MLNKNTRASRTGISDKHIPRTGATQLYKQLLSGMDKKGLLKLLDMRCKHGMPYWQHLACYFKAGQRKAERIGFIDIETAPNLGYTWGTYEQNVIELKKEWYILCFGWKWLDEPTEVHTLPDHKTEKAMLAKLWHFLDAADVVVAHNGDNFDIKKINARFIRYGFEPPSPYRTIDTLKYARKIGAFNSNRLNDLSNFMRYGKKVETGGFQLWLDCMAGKESAWRKMRSYNKRDVVLLEKVFKRLHPWVPLSARKRVVI